MLGDVLDVCPLDLSYFKKITLIRQKFTKCYKESCT